MLARQGIRSHLLFRSDYAKAAERGIEVRAPKETFVVPPTSFGAHQAANPPKDLNLDLVIITTKTTSNAQLPAVLKPLVGPQTAILTLQNGLGNEAFLASHFPENPILGGTAFVSVHRVAPATVHLQHGGALAIGTHEKAPKSLAASVAQLLRRTGFRIDEMTSLNQGRWEKQLWNVPFNGLGGALVADTQKLLSTPEGTGLLRGIMEEVRRVAAADGAHLSEEMAESKINYTYSMGPYRTSMQLDRENGRPMEIETMFSSVLAIARKHSVQTPLIEKLELLLKAVDTSDPTVS